jgi:hypothetical protein
MSELVCSEVVDWESSSDSESPERTDCGPLSVLLELLVLLELFALVLVELLDMSSVTLFSAKTSGNIVLVPLTPVLSGDARAGRDVRPVRSKSVTQSTS